MDRIAAAADHARPGTIVAKEGLSIEVSDRRPVSSSLFRSRTDCINGSKFSRASRRVKQLTGVGKQGAGAGDGQFDIVVRRSGQTAVAR